MPGSMQPLPLPEVIFDDGELFAVCKPAGVHSVMQRSSRAPSIAQALIRAQPELASAAPTPEDGGLINRLDGDTSGILLGAKSKESWGRFSELLKSGGIEKRYLVILEGRLMRPCSISGWIGSPYRRGSKVRVYTSPPSSSVRALPAHTEVSPLHFDTVSNTTYAVVHCPVARRHQVRAHCAALGYPLLGDTLYGAARRLHQVAPREERREFFLHAGWVQFNHPRTQEQILLEAPVPEWVSNRYETPTEQA
ncbi:MAG: hypothetical protein EBZ48_09730 [Proteobacteria bacterium]|nr:hypothetical protein [Pseudomonadota bacterium]